MARPEEVEDYVREAGVLLERLGPDGSTRLSDSQWRFLRETSMRHVRFAHARLERDRNNGLDILRRLFRLGTVPTPDGHYDGELMALSTGLLSDPFFEWLTRIYQPWRGKTFDPATSTGDNVFTDNPWAKATGKLGFPGYRIENEQPPGTMRVFPYRTHRALDIEDEEIEVLRIVYSDSPNPLPVRRMMDEVVELPGGYLLGKAHMRGLREFRRICFFGLMKPSD